MKYKLNRYDFGDAIVYPDGQDSCSIKAAIDELNKLQKENEALKAKLDRAMTYLEFATLENRSQREAEFNLKDLEGDK